MIPICECIKKGEGAGFLAQLNCVAVFNLLEEREAENNSLPAEKYLAAPQTGFGLFLLATKQ